MLPLVDRHERPGVSAIDRNFDGERATTVGQSKLLRKDRAVYGSFAVAVAVALAATLSLIVGAVAGFLAWQAGAHPASAVLRAGLAFGGSLGLAVALISLFAR